MELDGTRNPKAALDALFPQPIDCGEGVVVRPFSLATYALLEKLGSYIVFPHDPAPDEVVKSLYVCTHDPREVFRDFDKLGELAFGWAATLRPGIVRAVTAAVLKQVEAVRGAMPPEGSDPKKATMAG